MSERTFTTSLQNPSVTEPASPEPYFRGGQVVQLSRRIAASNDHGLGSAYHLISFVSAFYVYSWYTVPQHLVLCCPSTARLRLVLGALQPPAPCRPTKKGTAQSAYPCCLGIDPAFNLCDGLSFAKLSDILFPSICDSVCFSSRPRLVCTLCTFVAHFDQERQSRFCSAPSPYPLRFNLRQRRHVVHQPP